MKAINNIYWNAKNQKLDISGTFGYLVKANNTALRKSDNKVALNDIMLES